MNISIADYINNNTHKKWLVVSDLDGTLLDHHHYDFESAKPAINALNNHHIPIIINSSKTESEIISLRNALNNTHPFIIENGSAIITPRHYFTADVSTDNSSSLERILLGTPRSELIETVNRLKPQFLQQYTHYQACSIEDIMQMTGLSMLEAEQSSQRRYTEPVKWLGDMNSKKRFIEAVKQSGHHILEGGRFIHVMGKTDKGKASKQLAQTYEQHTHKTIATIALGDSHNDIAMLKAADIAVVIRSHNHAPPEFDHPNKIISELYGPDGWNEVMQYFLLHLTGGTRQS